MRHALILILIGCSSSPSAIRRQPVLIEDRAHERTQNLIGAQQEISVPPDRLWPSLRLAYSDLGIPPATMDSKTFALGNRELWVVREFAGTPLSTLFSCGNDAVGPKANTHRLRMSVHSTLRSDGKGGSVLETNLEATAFKVGASSDPVSCGSTGRLERRLAGLVMKRAAVN